jgi:predicted DNA-binding protein (MmcQ/YjbR family)
MTHKEFEDILLKKPGAWLDYPFGEGVAVYKLGPKDGTAKMFALIAEGSLPIRISLKCDPVLAEKLREEYESVLPGYHLNKKHWNTIIDSGQLEYDYLLSLIELSYALVKDSLPKDVQNKIS